ncbi:hypothetical protein OAZ22_01085 [Pelagibacteraceae bacterium]|nr:hypothetical protein [Pelagibacteraceae bacterium]
MAISQGNANSEKLYEKLVSDWPSIFPDGNRNAAGPRFFKYILDENLEYEEFVEFNKLYCAVSGSLISPDTQPDEIYLKDVESNEKICGQYYKCCWPCLCDVMKYSETKKITIDFKDVTKDIYAIVIDNPCNKKDFPELVNRNYFCEGNELNNEFTYSVDNKLVIGLMHNGKKCDAYDIDYVNNNQITGPMCEVRNSMPLEELNFGMGDIFIRLAN